MQNKRGLEMEEIVKIIIVVVVLAILIGIVILVLKGKGFGPGGILDSIKNLLRFGRG